MESKKNKKKEERRKKKGEERHKDIATVSVKYSNASLFAFQGCIPLQGCQVNELTANPDEPGRHLFEIVPGEFPTSFLIAYFSITSHLSRNNTTTLHSVHLSNFIYLIFSSALLVLGVQIPAHPQ